MFRKKVMNNHKAFWTKPEETQLCHEIQMGKSFDEIANLHQRSTNAVRLRFAMILSKRLQKGEKKHRLTQEYNIESFELENLLKLYEDRQETQTMTNGATYSPESYKKIEDALTVITEKVCRIEKCLVKILKDCKK